MKVIGLISGGKDSCFNLIECVRNGHEVVALANLRPATSSGKDELDSYMFQTIGHEAIEAIAMAMELPLFRRDLQGLPLSTDMHYSSTPTPQDEVEDLYKLLLDVKTSMPEVQAVSVGAILSSYQRIRVESVCARLGLTSLAFMWEREQHELLAEIIDSGVEAVLVKIAACGLQHCHLGQSLREMHSTLTKLNTQFELNVCGEGGEYETFTLDMPLYKKRIHVDKSEIIRVSEDSMAPVAYYRINKFSLVDKDIGEITSGDKRVDVHERDDKNDVEEFVGEGWKSYDTTCMQSVQDMPVITSSSTIPISALSISFNTGKLSVEGLTVNADSHTLTTPEMQMQHVLHRLREILLAHSMTPNDVTRVHLIVSDMTEFALINKVYISMFNERPPSRVCVQLPLSEGIYVQLHCVAHTSTSTSVQAITRISASTSTPTSISRSALSLTSREYTTLSENDTDISVPKNRGCVYCSSESKRGVERGESKTRKSQLFKPRECLHVQSISRWCPANIGPYSQAVTQRNRVYLAGQIGLIPNSLTLIETPQAQAVLSLRHVQRVCDSVKSSTDLVLGGVCYITEPMFVPYAREALAQFGMTSAAVIFVVAGRLPREASVEWDLVSMTTPESQGNGYSDDSDDVSDHDSDRIWSQAHVEITPPLVPMHTIARDIYTIEQPGGISYSLVALKHNELSLEKLVECVRTVVGQTTLKRMGNDFEQEPLGSVRIYVPTIFSAQDHVGTVLRNAISELKLWTCECVNGRSLPNVPALGVFSVKSVGATLGLGKTLCTRDGDVVIGIIIE
eukprot:CFRG2316T1